MSHLIPYSPQKLVTNLRTIWFSRLNGSVQLILVLYDPKNDVITYDETSGSFEIFFFQSIDYWLNVIQNKNEGIKGICDFSSKGM